MCIASGADLERVDVVAVALPEPVASSWEQGLEMTAALLDSHSLKGVHAKPEMLTILWFPETVACSPRARWRAVPARCDLEGTPNIPPPVDIRLGE